MSVELMDAYVSIWPKLGDSGKVSQDLADALAGGSNSAVDKIVDNVSQIISSSTKKAGGIVEKVMSSRLGNAFKAASSKISDTIGPALTKALDSPIGQAAQSFVTKMGSAMGTVGGVIKNVGIGAFAVVAGAATDLLENAIAAGWQRLESIDVAKARLNGLKYSAEQIQAVEEAAMQSVLDTQYGYGEAINVASTAVAAGIKDQEDLQRYLTSVADTASIAGTSMESMGHVFNRVATTGRATNYELNMLANRGIPIYEYLANTIGTTTDKVRDMARNGEIDLETFRTAIENNIGGAGKIMGNASIPAITDNIYAAMSRLGAGILKDVYPAYKEFLLQWKAFLNTLQPAADAMGVGIGHIIELFRPLAAKVLPTLQGALQKLEPVFNKAGEAILRIADVVVPVLESAFDALVAALNWLYDEFGFVWDAIVNVVDTALELIEGLVEVATDLMNGEWSAAARKTREVVEKLWDNLVSSVATFVDDFVKWLSTIPDRLATLFAHAADWLISAGVALLNGLLKGVQTKLGEIVDWIKGGGIAQAIIGAFTGAASWLVDSGRNIVQGLLNGMDSMMSRISTKSTEMGKEVSKAFDKYNGIKSPSKLYEQKGVYIVEGLINGIADEENDLANTMNMLSHYMMGGFANGLNSSVSAGRGGINIQNMTVQANDVDEFVMSVERELARLGAM